MAISRKGKRPIVVDGETFLWRHSAGGAHIVDLQGRLNVFCISRVALVKGPRFRAVKGCGGLHRCFECPDFFWIAVYPRYVAKCIRWCIAQGPDPVEVDRAELRARTPPRRLTPLQAKRKAELEGRRHARREARRSPKRIKARAAVRARQG